jgi:hypothetical protein
MKTKLSICAAALVTIFAGSAYLATPAQAAGTMGCTFDQYATAIQGARRFCWGLGYSGGLATAVDCSDPNWVIVTAECWTN